jgi:hypothetical protein
MGSDEELLLLLLLLVAVLVLWLSNGWKVIDQAPCWNEEEMAAAIAISLFFFDVMMLAVEVTLLITIMLPNECVVEVACYVERSEISVASKAKRKCGHQTEMAGFI